MSNKIDWDRPLRTEIYRYPVRIISKGLKGRHPIALAYFRNDTEYVMRANEEGETTVCKIENVPPEVTYMYKNVYHDSGLHNKVYKTLEECLTPSGRKSSGTLIGILRLTYEDNNLIRKELLDDYLEVQVVHSKN